MKTKIMNPIYDATFKYLMQDIETASHVFTILLGQETQVLHFLSTEYSQKKRINGVENTDFSVNRLDFVAEVKVNDRLVKVILEIQKSTYTNSIPRFSNYVGQQYCNRRVVEKNNEINENDENDENENEEGIDGGNQLEQANQTISAISENNNNNEHDYNLPIISVYLLGKNLEKVQEAFTRLKRVLIDIETKEELPYKYDEEFLELLSHDVIVVQIKRLSNKTKKSETKRDKKLRSFFKIFDQKQKLAEHDGTVLMIDTNDLDDETIKAVERLSNAMLDKQLQYEIQQQHNFDVATANDQKTIEYQKKLIKAAEKREAEAQQKLINIAKKLLSKGFSIEDVAEDTGLTKQDIEKYCKM